MSNKKGVSLIVLVITIIIMIILAGTIMLSLNNTGIIKKAQGAVSVSNEKEVQHLASLLWAEAYTKDIREQGDLENYVLAGLAKAEINTNEYAVTVTKKGVKVVYLPENYRGGNVVEIVDNVPVPKGFVASKATGENTKNGGLVIYEGTDPVNNANVDAARRTRNQYVWVPVESSSFQTKFIRKSFGLSDVSISNTLGSNYWEVVLDGNNIPLSTQSSSYMSTKTLAEVQAMYASVKKYGGFYIARYEAGINTQRTSNTTIVKGSNVYSMMGKIPYNFVTWGASITSETGGAVEAARSIYPAADTTGTYGVASTLIYGVQWDATLQWWLDTKAVTSVTNSSSYGNYRENALTAADFNDGAKYATLVDLGSNQYTISSYSNITSTYTKAANKNAAYTTGALKLAEVNNIYDMASNFWDLTMEGSGSSLVIRGGCFTNTGNSGNRPVAKRATASPSTAQFHTTFRVALYIK